MGLMVGDRRFPGATILGSVVFYFFRQPSRVGPADSSRASVLPDGLFFPLFLVPCASFWVLFVHAWEERYSRYGPAFVNFLNSDQAGEFRSSSSRMSGRSCQDVSFLISDWTPQSRSSGGYQAIHYKRYITSPCSSMRIALWRWQRTTVHSSGILADLPQHDFPVGDFRDRKKWLADVGKRRFTLRFQGAESSEQRGRNSATDHRHARCCRGLRFQSDTRHRCLSHR